MADQATVLDRAVQKAAVTRQVAVAPGAIAALPELVRQSGGGQVIVIADVTTMEVAGSRTLAALAEAGISVGEPVVLNDKPRVKPHAATARSIAAQLRERKAMPVSVGAGVVNDLAKYAAELAQTPYICVATAASMDGYAASGAALLDDGFKRTLECRPPVAVIADLDILKQAPHRMAGWGYGDLAGKIVAGADWILADALGEELINREPFDLVQGNVREWLSEPGAVGAGEATALGALMEGLLISGFAMQAHGNSRPASGAEHLISHLWEMERLTFQDEPAAHGACVGIGTVGMLALYDWFLRQDVSSDTVGQGTGAASATQVEREIAAAFTEAHLAASARTEMNAKLGGAERRQERLKRLVAIWPELSALLRTTCVPPAEMERWLKEAGAPAHPHDLGVSLEKFAADYRRARLIRRRYTILDCLDDLGWLDKGIAALFVPEGFWGRRATAEASVSAMA